MKEVRYFEAEDGTRFENESDCREYELTQELLNNEKNFEIYDSKQTKMTPFFNGKLQEPDMIFYINVKTESAVCALTEWFEWFDVRCPFECRYPHHCIGHWMYDENRRYEDCWVRIEEIHDRIHSILDNFE